MDQFGLDREHYDWYRDFRRYGSVPYAGFGLGFERLVVYVCGLSNIRDAIPYPRAPGSAEFCWSRDWGFGIRDLKSPGSDAPYPARPAPPPTRVRCPNDTPTPNPPSPQNRHSAVEGK